MLLRFSLLFIILIWLLTANASFPNPNDVRNEFSGEPYNNALIDPLVKKLETSVTDKINDPRLPDDVALIQALTSLQKAMFELAAFYSKFYRSTNFTRFGKGVAIEFEAQRCDEVYSSKFPRFIPTYFPWKYYGDSSYYLVNCKLEKVNSRKKRSVVSLARNNLPRKDTFWERFKKMRKRKSIKRNNRLRRAVVFNDKSYCGNSDLFNTTSGTLRFPKEGQSNYRDNLECRWVIKVPVRYAVKITFVNLDLEYDKSCNYDNVSFYDGNHPTTPPGTPIETACGTKMPSKSISSKSYEMTIRFQSDGDKSNFKGFLLNWTIDNPRRDKSELLLTSTIVVDQVGDLNIDTMDPSVLSIGEKPNFKFSDSFSLKLNNPSTCPLISEDETCYFETRPYIISKIISTGMYPEYKLPEDAIEVVFEHAIETKSYPELYFAPKYCVTWNTTVPHTGYGAWSRRHGKLIFTSLDRSTCRFSIPGIHALAAAVPPPVPPAAFRFTHSWYFALYFSIFWITLTFVTVVTGARINIPEWLNLNQLLALLLFCGVTLTGMEMEFDKETCSLLTFFLYYFGLAVFVWHFLKAAQFTGVFDKFFRKERNLYAFYLLLGWCIPMFIAGMAGGASVTERSETQSCWMALLGGKIWGYTAPTYFLVLAIGGLYYNGLRRTKSRIETFNYPKLMKRAIRDIVVLLCLILTWGFGVLCIVEKYNFTAQFLFSTFLCFTVMLLCLYARQKRRGFEKIYDLEDDDYGQKHKRKKNKCGLSDEQLAQKYARKWRRIAKNPELSLTVAIEGLREARLWGYRDMMTQANREDKWNKLYSDGADNMAYDDDEYNYDDDDPLENIEEIKDENEEDDEISLGSEDNDSNDEDDAKNDDNEDQDQEGNETDVGSLGESEEDDEDNDENDVKEEGATAGKSSENAQNSENQKGAGSNENIAPEHDETNTKSNTKPTENIQNTEHQNHQSVDEQKEEEGKS